jgi:transposase
MHKEHKGGEEVEVDWAGDIMSYVDRKTGEIKPAYVFVSVLPASAYPFAYAFEDVRISNWIAAHVMAYEYYGGVPKVTIPDNTKTAVIKADLVDPVLNKSYNEMAKHYHTTIIPARAGKPKDKAADENMVGHVSRRIIAALRNRQFFSIHEINQAIREELVKLIHRPFQKMAGTRQSAFETIDKPFLQPLPVTRYEYAQWKETKIQFNYHIDYDGFFYSVHYSYVNSPCSVRATSKIIEIYIGSERVAVHSRNYNPYKRYTTLSEHMPESHQAVSGWSQERFLSWADKTGPNTRELIKHILESREYPVQTYRTCMGIMRLGKDYSIAIVEKASREALDKNACSYKYFGIILKQVATTISKTPPEKIISHDNIRGINAFLGGGISAK